MPKLSRQEQEFDDLHFPDSKRPRFGVLEFGSLSIFYNCDSDGSSPVIERVELAHYNGDEKALLECLDYLATALIGIPSTTVDLVKECRNPAKEKLV